MAEVFISYQRKDYAQAEQVAKAFETLGFTVWWDSALMAGDAFQKVIRDELDKSKAAIVLWSRTAVESSWVIDEAAHALKAQKLCPARIHGMQLPFGFGQVHTDDIVGWNG